MSGYSATRLIGMRSYHVTHRGLPGEELCAQPISAINRKLYLHTFIFLYLYAPNLQMNTGARNTELKSLLSEESEQILLSF